MIFFLPIGGYFVGGFLAGLWLALHYVFGAEERSGSPLSRRAFLFGWGLFWGLFGLGVAAILAQSVIPIPIAVLGAPCLFIAPLLWWIALFAWWSDTHRSRPRAKPGEEGEPPNAWDYIPFLDQEPQEGLEPQPSVWPPAPRRGIEPVRDARHEEA